MHLKMNLRSFDILHYTMCFFMSMFTALTYFVSASPLIDHNTQQFGCHPLSTTHKICSRWYQTAQLPNIFGHDTLLKAQYELNTILSKLPNTPSNEVMSFICILYLPPCSLYPSGSYHQYMPLPCRAMCEAASVKNSRENKYNITIDGNRNPRPWPVMCHTLPTQKCYIFEENTGMTYVKRSNGGNLKVSHKVDEIVKDASIASELGDNSNGESYDLEVVSLSTNQDNGRRYDITDLGDPDLFQGWADVQGIGSASDYCRVVGKSKRRFLSCHLSGNANQGHHYVSKLGFDIGYPGTWFMRDMDGDGRDDYCRCVGPPSDSKVTCMKAGEKGFHGSPMQTGSQHSFVLTSSAGCHNRRVNAMFGE